MLLAPEKHFLAQHREVRLVEGKPKHDQVSIEAVQHVPTSESGQGSGFQLRAVRGQRVRHFLALSPLLSPLLPLWGWDLP